MNLIHTIDASPEYLSEGVPDPSDDYWYDSWGAVHQGAGSAGVVVTPDTAMRVTAVMACVRVLAETVGSLPLILYRRVGNNGKERATDSPLYRPLHHRPNVRMTGMAWREMSQAHVCLRGKSFSEIRTTRAGLEFWPIHPDRVTIEQLNSGKLRFKVQQPAGGEKTFVQEEMLYLPNLSVDGVEGLSPINLARDTIGVAMASRTRSASLMRNGARPGVVLEHPGKLTPDASRNLRGDWERLHAGPHNAGRTAVLVEGMKAHELGMTNEDFQFVEIEQLTLSDIARIFRVPAHLINDLSKATFSNIEQQSLDFVVHTLLPVLCRWEQTIQRDVIDPYYGETDEYFAEFLVDGLLRGDAKARAEAMQIRFQCGSLSQNEWRSKENDNPFDGGDRYYVMTNLAPVDRIDDVLDKQTEPTPAPVQKPPAAIIPNAPADSQMVSLERVRNCFGMFCRQAAERTSKFEWEVLSKRIDKRGEDKERFAAWLADFYSGKLQSYVRQQVTQISEAWKEAGGVEWEVEPVVASVCQSGAEWADSDVPDPKKRLDEIATILTKVIYERPAE